MATINISANIEQARSYLSNVQRKQLPFATSFALNKTAQKVKEAQQKEMRDVFDRPTPFTLNSIFIKSSNKSNLTATVGLKSFASKGNAAAKYLQAQIAGGERRLKGYEVALRSIGVLPEGYFTVPGEAAKMDLFGNIQRGQIVQILAYFRANRETLSNSNDKMLAKLKRGTKKRTGIQYFVGAPGDGKAPLGIWQKNYAGKFTGPFKSLQPVLIFVQSSNYEKNYDFKYVAELAVKKNFDDEFRAALEIALMNAR